MGLKNRKGEWDLWFATVLYVCMYNLDASSEASCKKLSIIGWAVLVKGVCTKSITEKVCR